MLDQRAALEQGDLGHLRADVHADHVAADGLAPALTAAPTALGLRRRVGPGLPPEPGRPLPPDPLVAGAASAPAAAVTRSAGARSPDPLRCRERPPPRSPGPALVPAARGRAGAGPVALAPEAGGLTGGRGRGPGGPTVTDLGALRHGLRRDGDPAGHLSGPGCRSRPRPMPAGHPSPASGAPPVAPAGRPRPRPRPATRVDGGWPRRRPRRWRGLPRRSPWPDPPPGLGDEPPVSPWVGDPPEPAGSAGADVLCGRGRRRRRLRRDLHRLPGCSI